MGLVSSVNVMAREIAVKIVFYGPGLSGKTTSLRKVYETVRPANRGEMISLATEGDRTLFFDFLPVKVERVGDCSVRLALYTVPGQVFYNATRKLVLQGADGVVFVADSQPEAMDQNLESIRNLAENLEEQGLNLATFPHIIQYNKRDIPSALPLEDLRAALNRYAVPDFETCATNGRGILDALKGITRLVIKDLRHKKVVPSASVRPEQTTHFPAEDQRSASGLEGQIRQHLAQSDLPLPSAHAPREGALGPCAALAPTALLDYARAADDAFSRGDCGGCIRACLEGVRRGLAFAGEGAPSAQAFLLGVHGPDLLRLEQLLARPIARTEDAAFALFVLMQVLARLARAGLPTPAP
jgi:mutual gliding-motility protein MglA